MFIRNSNLHIRRFEFKYLVREENLDKIRRSISNFVIPDPYAKNAKGGVYQVSSIYFDDYKVFSYFEKLDGIKGRKKFRIRTYESKISKTSKVYLEIKKRDEVVIFKDRSLVPFDRFVSGLVRRNYNNLLRLGERDVTSQFIYYLMSKSLKPNVLISYKREAYLDERNHSFRITLDQGLCAKSTRELSFDRTGLVEILPGFTILEAKFNRIMPAWFGQVIRAHNLERVSFSKYCFSLEACGMVPRTDLSILPQTWIF